MKQHPKTLLILTELDEHYKILDMEVTQVVYQQQTSGINKKTVACPNCTHEIDIQVEISVNSDCLLSDCEDVPPVEETEIITEDFIMSQAEVTKDSSTIYPVNIMEIQDVTAEHREDDQENDKPNPEEIYDADDVTLIEEEIKLEDYQNSLAQDHDLNVVEELIEEDSNGKPVSSSRLYKINDFVPPSVLLTQYPPTSPEKNFQTEIVELFECPKCDEKFKTKYSYRIHKNIHTEKYKCAICGRPHAKKERLLAHLKREHTEEEQDLHHRIKSQEQSIIPALEGDISEDSRTGTESNNATTKPPIDATYCTICGLHFTVSNYFAHMKQHGLDSYICGICGKALKSRKTFKHHMVRAHTNTTDSTVTYNCSLCYAKYLLKRDLNHHMKLKHIQDKPIIECPDCYEVFQDRRKLSVHRQQHGETIIHRKHKCSVCEKRFSRLSSLKDHLVTHSRERNFSCNVCHQKYPRKSYLRIHSRIHTGERPYICPKQNCGSRFYDPASLRQHRLMHERKDSMAVENVESEEVTVVETSEVYYEQE